jgi:hypothetical protein
LFASVGFGAGCSAVVYQLTATNKKKFFFISIHKPPASIRFAPIKHALIVTVETFKFSSRQGGVAYELSWMDPIELYLIPYFVYRHNTIYLDLKQLK